MWNNKFITGNAKITTSFFSLNKLKKIRKGNQYKDCEERKFHTLNLSSFLPVYSEVNFIT
jgi:hypothetical protein